MGVRSVCVCVCVHGMDETGEVNVYVYGERAGLVDRRGEVGYAWLRVDGFLSVGVVVKSVLRVESRRSR